MPYIGEKLSAAGKVQNMEGVELQLDADGDTGITADTDDQVDIKIGGGDRVKIEVDGDTTITSNTNDANAGPILSLVRNRSSANCQDNDLIGELKFTGQPNALALHDFASIQAKMLDVSNTSEDAELNISILMAGTEGKSVLKFSPTEAAFNDDSEDVDFRVESNGNTHALFVDAGNDHVNIGTSTDHGGVLNVESTDNTATLVLACTDDDASAGPILNLTRSSASPADADLLGEINFNGKNDAGEDQLYATIDSRIRDASDGTEAGRLRVGIFNNGTEFNRLDMDTDETVFNEGSQSVDFRVESNGSVNAFFVDASEDSVAINSGSMGADSRFTVNGVKDGAFGRTCLRLRDTDSVVNSDNTMMVCDFSADGTATNGTYISFRDSGGEIGKINCAGGSSVSFNTTSDHRIKENIKPMSDAWDKIKAINLVNFTYKTHKTEPAQDGVIAHELQEIFPQAVTGEKDEMVTRADGTKDMELQGVDYGKMSTLLAKGLQEAMAKIETLEAKVAKLEG